MAWIGDVTSDDGFKAFPSFAKTGSSSQIDDQCTPVMWWGELPVWAQWPSQGVTLTFKVNWETLATEDQGDGSSDWEWYFNSHGNLLLYGDYCYYPKLTSDSKLRIKKIHLSTGNKTTLSTSSYAIASHNGIWTHLIFDSDWTGTTGVITACGVDYVSGADNNGRYWVEKIDLTTDAVTELATGAETTSGRLNTACGIDDSSNKVYYKKERLHHVYEVPLSGGSESSSGYLASKLGYKGFGTDYYGSATDGILSPGGGTIWDLGYTPSSIWFFGDSYPHYVLTGNYYNDKMDIWKLENDGTATLIETLVDGELDLKDGNILGPTLLDGRTREKLLQVGNGSWSSVIIPNRDVL
jgi:hypothetical protein